MVNKSFKYRIYPDNSQIAFLRNQFGSVRFVFNYFLNRRKTEYNDLNLKNLSGCGIQSDIKQKSGEALSQERSWIREARDFNPE